MSVQGVSGMASASEGQSIQELGNSRASEDLGSYCSASHLLGVFRPVS